jgi:hypothetical protein
VNWSEAAQAAFEREISIATFKGDNMEQVIERLRASKTAFADKERAEGRTHGRDWARLHASFEDLRTVANLDFDRQPDSSSYGALLDKALGNTDLSYDRSFWQDSEDWSIPSNEYVEAFVKGAKDVWNEVADKI